MQGKFAHGSVTGFVVNVERTGVSANGNPFYRVTIRETNGDRANYMTSADIMLSYAIGNAEYREHAHRFGLTRSGRLNGYADRITG
jgi:hypothetical protein